MLWARTGPILPYWATRRNREKYLTSLTSTLADTPPLPVEVTQLLLAWGEGRRDALHALMPVVYDDLHRIAAGYMRREPSGHALQPTALVSEAYLRLIDQRRVQWQNRAHFFAVAAGIMRRILVDHARQRRAEKRGGAWERVTLTGADVAQDGPNQVDVLALHESLEKLAVFDPQQERIVELRYFGGLTIEETAEVVGVSNATVVRDWTIAKAWLRAHLSGQSA